MHIVIADSSRVVLQILENEILQDGDTVTTFTNGTEAYDFIKENEHVEVLITSFELQEMSGLELCWETRALAQHRNSIYVIAMSSNDDRHKLIEALDSGADDFIRKPPAQEELMARLRAARKLTALQNELITLATIDPLTNIFNRRAFFDKGELAIQDANENDLYGVMFDIDHFKKVNDTYGHDIGDIAIQQVASLGASFGGILGRLGGEEFALLLPHSDKQAAMDAGETMRQNISQIRVSTEKGVLSFTCSFGVTVMQEGDDVHTILKRADVALYHAKETGRNKVVFYDDMGTTNIEQAS